MSLTLVGRASELERLEAVLAEAGETGTALLLQGDPGAGKTVLLDAVAARARSAGARVLRVVGVETERELAFSALHQLLYPLLGHLPELPEYQGVTLEQVLSIREGSAPGRFAISAAALSLLQHAADRQPLFVVVDDVHWIDRSSAEVLTFLTRRLNGCRASFVLAARSGWNGFLDPAGLPVLTVGPLAARDAQLLLDTSHPGLSDPTRRRLLDEAGGNPLALVELPGQLTPAQRDGDEALPTNLPLSSRLESVFADRIRLLDASTRFALLLVALDGQRPGNLREIRTAAERAGQEWDDGLLEASEHTGLVRVDHLADHVTFRHPLARSCLVHMSPGRHRRSAHEALAATLEREPERRAWHLAHAAEDPDEAVAAELTGAAELALARGGAAEAAAAFRRAAELSPDQADRARRLDEAAFAASKGGLLETAHELAGSGAAESLRGAAAAAYVLFHRDGDSDGVFRTLVPVMESAPMSASPEDVAAYDDAFYVLLNCAVWAGRPDLWPSVYQVLDRVSETARMCFDCVADPARTAHDVRARLDVATAELPPHTPFWRVNWLIYTALYLDCFSYYDAVWRDFVGQAAYDGHRFVLLARAHDAYMRGEWDTQLAIAAEGTSDAAEHGYNFTHVLFKYGMASVAAGRGDEEALNELSDEIAAWAVPRRFMLMVTSLRETRARIAIGRGDFEEAYRQAALLTPPGELPAHYPHVQRVFLDLVEAAVRTGRVEEAQAHVEAGQRARLDLISPHHEVILAAAAAVAAPEDRADKLYRAALAVPDAALWAFEYARIHLLYGEWLRRRREHKAARTHLSAAQEAFERMKAPLWAQRARNELRAAGVVTRVPGEGGAAQLSAQEYRIAELAASGLSNKEIGRQMNISPRTVGAHLYRVFPKLGVTARAALRDALDTLSGPNTG
ncbi:AAA family ATPase [Streptomyces griseoviridis]|uniref:LuxR family transcriptional regulator n=1 Tax=Streptomyces griseoviridis TaxID=45398 RepID=A0A918GQS9_STRGD|nr:LuxR family transcriptional regulator [Streptomyces niveoruber]GGS55416.1 LuxR family transcriptional regulator [Streptomyces niveoruber]